MNTTKEFNKSLKELFPSSILETTVSDNGKVSILGNLKLGDFYRFSFRETWINENLGKWMPEKWWQKRLCPEMAGISSNISIGIGTALSGVNLNVPYEVCSRKLFQKMLNLILDTVSAFKLYFEDQLKTCIKNEDVDYHKYTLIVTSEADIPGKHLDYFSDNPWEGNLEDVIQFDTVEELDAYMGDIEGLFYQLFENEHGTRLGYGVIDCDYPETDIRDFENPEPENIQESDEANTSGSLMQKTAEEYPGQLIILSGFSRAGKDTIAKKLLEESDQYYLSISATTREPRAGEKNEKDYYFVTKEQFQQMAAQNAFLEYAEYAGNFYGTPVFPITDALKKGRNVILVIETKGAMKVKEIFPQALSIFVAAPAEDILKRMQETPVSNQNKRIDEMLLEISVIPKYDYLILNKQGKLEKSVDLIHGIIRGSQQKTSLNLDVIERLKKEFESIQKLTEMSVPASSVVRTDDKSIFHVGDTVIHFKWEMNRDRDIQDYVYEITGFPKNTETEEEYVAYRSVSHPDKEWVRLYTDFVSEVDHAKYPDIKQKYRFVKVN